MFMEAHAFQIEWLLYIILPLLIIFRGISHFYKFN